MKSRVLPENREKTKVKCAVTLRKKLAAETNYAGKAHSRVKGWA